MVEVWFVSGHRLAWEAEVYLEMWEAERIQDAYWWLYV